jgi:hypothetical protein
MSTALAPAQNDRKAWHGTRLGKFTASTIGELMVEAGTLTEEEAEIYAHLVSEPRYRELKSGPNKGQMAEDPKFGSKVKAAMQAAGIVRFGKTALSLIKTKAIERVTLVQEHNTSNGSMRRGLLLEPAALHLLNDKWTKIHEAGYQPYGNNSGATPDGLVSGGQATMDLKAPEDGGDLLRFAQEVPDGDFDALERWDRNYAWQIMMQAKASGVKTAYLVYFSDRLPIYPLEADDVEILQTIINAMADKYSQEHEYPWGYTWDKPGYFYVVRRFELTEERSQKIDRHLQAAEVECEKMAKEYQSHLPTPATR